MPLIKQRERMSSRHPQFAVKHYSSRRIVWEGIVQPTPLSEDYRARIEYNFNCHPVVRILSPALQLVPGASELPHTYKDDDLCLYYPKNGEWRSEFMIADYIVPWITMWLFFYEIWLATGEWRGGGTEHSPRNF